MGNVLGYVFFNYIALNHDRLLNIILLQSQIQGKLVLW